MGFRMVEKATETGFMKFSVMAKDMVDMFRTARALRDDMCILKPACSSNLTVGSWSEPLGRAILSCCDMTR